MAFPLLALLGPLLGAAAGGIGSYFGSRSQAQPGGGMNALGGLNNRASFTQTPGGGELAQFEQLNPQQQQLQQQLVSMLSGQLGQGGEDPIADYARKQFQERGLPELLERFTAGGSNLSGSGIQNAILRAQTDLEGNLAAQRYGMLPNLLGQGLQPTTQQAYSPPQPGFLQNLLGNVGGGLSSIAPFFAAKYALGSDMFGGNR